MGPGQPFAIRGGFRGVGVGGFLWGLAMYGAPFVGVLEPAGVVLGVVLRGLRVFRRRGSWAAWRRVWVVPAGLLRKMAHGFDG